MPDIGSTLREARMRQRIDITEVEAQTKIRAKYLRAIENEEWDLLPGPIYAKSFLRTYGDYLGLDSRMLVDQFRRRHEHPSEHEFRPISSRPPRDRDRRPPRRIPSWVSILAAVVVILVALGVVGELSGGSNTAPTTAKQSVSARHKTRPIVPAPTTTTVRPPAPTQVKLKMVPINAVYVCLVNGAGTKLINEQTFTPGQTIPTATASRLLLTLGNNGVQLKVNGKPIPVTASPAAIRLLITPPDNVQHIPLSESPTCP